MVWSGESNWRVTADSWALSKGLPGRSSLLPSSDGGGETGIRDLAPKSPPHTEILAWRERTVRCIWVRRWAELGEGAA